METRKIVIRKRPWLARLVRLPITALRIHRIGTGWMPSIRLALVILK
jgi:hypothetical protein